MKRCFWHLLWYFSHSISTYALIPLFLGTGKLKLWIWSRLWTLCIFIEASYHFVMVIISLSMGMEREKLKFGGCLVAKSCQTLVTKWIEALFCPLDSPGKNIVMGCHFLLQGIFLTQGSKPGLLHCRQILYQLSHQGRLPFIFIHI